jgi:hypothetical protein
MRRDYAMGALRCKSRKGQASCDAQIPAGNKAGTFRTGECDESMQRFNLHKF